jgi:hypothetical protein
MQKDSSKGTYIMLAIIIVVSLGLYFYFKGTPSEGDLETLETSGTPEAIQAEEAANKVVAILNQIDSLKIDDSLFSSMTYRSLVDYTITIPEQNVGRPNPFAPIPGIKKAPTPGTSR